MISTLSMARFRGVQVNLPKAASGSQAPAESVTVTLTKEGQLFLNKEEVGRESLLQSLRQQLKKNPELLVIINADNGVQHGKVVEIMDEARQAGVAKLSIAVKPKENKQ